MSDYVTDERLAELLKYERDDLTYAMKEQLSDTDKQWHKERVSVIQELQRYRSVFPDPLAACKAAAADTLAVNGRCAFVEQCRVAIAQQRDDVLSESEYWEDRERKEIDES